MNQIIFSIQDFFFHLSIFLHVEEVFIALFPDYLPSELRIDPSFSFTPFDYSDFGELDYEEDYEELSEEPFIDQEAFSIVDFMEDCDRQSEWLEEFKKSTLQPTAQDWSELNKM